MNFLAWLRLLVLEERLQLQFGKYNKYRCLCLERGARRSRDRLPIAREVLHGPGVNVLEAWGYHVYLKNRGIRP